MQHGRTGARGATPFVFERYLPACDVWTDLAWGQRRLVALPLERPETERQLASPTMDPRLLTDGQTWNPLALKNMFVGPSEKAHPDEGVRRRGAITKEQAQILTASRQVLVRWRDIVQQRFEAGYGTLVSVWRFDCELALLDSIAAAAEDPKPVLAALDRAAEFATRAYQAESTIDEVGYRRPGKIDVSVLEVLRLQFAARRLRAALEHGREVRDLRAVTLLPSPGSNRKLDADDLAILRRRARQLQEILAHVDDVAKAEAIREDRRCEIAWRHAVAQADLTWAEGDRR